MERTFSAVVSRDGGWFVAQCCEVDVASQGETEAEALANLREALELWFEDQPEAPAAIYVQAA
jgi:predicted RNase H-like HicB family nuclease